MAWRKLGAIYRNIGASNVKVLNAITKAYTNTGPAPGTREAGDDRVLLQHGGQRADQGGGGVSRDARDRSGQHDPAEQSLDRALRYAPLRRVREPRGALHGQRRLLQLPVPRDPRADGAGEHGRRRELRSRAGSTRCRTIPTWASVAPAWRPSGATMPAAERISRENKAAHPASLFVQEFSDQSLAAFAADQGKLGAGADKLRAAQASAEGRGLPARLPAPSPRTTRWWRSAPQSPRGSDREGERRAGETSALDNGRGGSSVHHSRERVRGCRPRR